MKLSTMNRFANHTGTPWHRHASRRGLHLSASAAVVLLAIVGTAVADDAKRFAGAECVGYSNANEIRVVSTGVIYNTSKTKDARVICPIVHDIMGGTIRGGTVTVIDRNNDSSSQVVKCNLMAHRRNNGRWFGTFWPAESSGNGDPQILSFGPDNTRSSDHYYYRCTIPRRDANTNLASYIVSYTINEKS